MKMKAFFCSLKGENERKIQIISELERLTGAKDCSYHDLEIVKSFFAKAEKSFGRPNIPIYDKEKKEFIFLGCKEPESRDGPNWIDLNAESSTL